MTPQEEEIIRKWNDEQKSEVTIRLVVSQDERSKQIERFCREISALAPKINITTKKADDGQPPVIKLGHRILCHAVPLGTELEPFLESVTLVQKNDANLPEAVRESLEELSLPAELKLFVTDQCPFCPNAVRAVMPLVLANELISLTIIDGFLFKEMAESYSIQSAPTLILDDDFRWTGTIDVNEVIDMIVKRDPERLKSSSLENMITEGQASRVAKMMLEKETIFQAFIELLVHEKWPVRLGAMVALEEINEKNHELAAKAIFPLMDKFLQAEAQVKGDIIYICGQSGNRKIISKLETILSENPDNDIKDAANEAIERIMERCPDFED